MQTNSILQFLYSRRSSKNSKFAIEAIPEKKMLCNSISLSAPFFGAAAVVVVKESLSSSSRECIIQNNRKTFIFSLSATHTYTWVTRQNCFASADDGFFGSAQARSAATSWEDAHPTERAPLARELNFYAPLTVRSFSRVRAKHVFARKLVFGLSQDSGSALWNLYGTTTADVAAGVDSDASGSRPNSPICKEYQNYNDRIYTHKKIS